MKKLIRLIGIFAILWIGLYAGLVRPDTSAITFNSAGTSINAIFNNKVTSNGISNDFYDVAIPANTALVCGTTSRLLAFVNFTDLSPAETFSLDAADGINELDDNSSHVINGSSVAEQETYAMLLVCLGMLGFTARRRRVL